MIIGWGKKTKCYYQHLLISFLKDAVCGCCCCCWWWTINIIGRLCVCVCVSSSYRFAVNSSYTHIHKAQLVFFLSLSPPYTRLSFFFCSFLYSSSTSVEYFFPIVPLRSSSSSILELSHWKFSIWLAFHSDVTRSFASTAHTMAFSFFFSSFVFILSEHRK
jgi:hypothetical protein